MIRLPVNYFDRAQSYYSASGRFMSLDPKGFAAGVRNLYGYARNDPTNAVDTDRESPIVAFRSAKGFSCHPMLFQCTLSRSERRL
jgi:hypothetical protein